jgi:hypothetical protein
MWIPTDGCFITVKEKFAALSRFQQILCVVFALHLSVVFVLCVHHFVNREKPKAKIVVRTLHKPPVIRSKVVAAAPPQIKKVKKEVDPLPKKQISPPAQKCLSTSKPKEGVSVDPSLIAQMENELSVLEEKRNWSKSPSLQLPKEPQEAKTQEIDPSYGEVLVEYLQNALELPELGEVKVDLELDVLGHILRVDIVESKSKKNGEFLKKRLPELSLPCFNENQKSHATVVFTITFKNMDAPSSCSF